MDIGGNISQLLREAKVQGNLRNHPLAGRLGLNGRPASSGFMMNSAPEALDIPPLGQGGGLDEFSNLVALAQAQAEMSINSGADSPEKARSLAQLRAMSAKNEMLQGMLSLDQGGEGRAMALIQQMNAEAALSSENFGNLLGNGASSAFDSGQTFSPAEMSSLRQKNGFLRPTAPAEAGAAETPGAPASEENVATLRGDHNLMMPYGRIRAPRRQKVDNALQMVAQKKPEKPADSPAPNTEETPDSDKNFTRDDLNRLVGKVAKSLSLDPALVMAVIKTESNFDHQAVSRVGAKGLMQLMPGTAKDLGVKDPFNPVENVWGGARYLKQMLDRHNGSVDKALASYNWGPGNFDRYRRKGGQMPKETRNYIARVNQNYNNFKKDLA